MLGCVQPPTLPGQQVTGQLTSAPAWVPLCCYRWKGSLGGESTGLGEGPPGLKLTLLQLAVCSQDPLSFSGALLPSQKLRGFDETFLGTSFGLNMLQ